MPVSLARKAIEDSAKAISLAPAEKLAQIARSMAQSLAEGGTI